METATPGHKRKSRWSLTAFIVAVVCVCGLLTFGVASRLESTRQKTKDWHEGHLCVGVLRGDLVEVEMEGRTNQVQLLGLHCPPIARDAEATDMAATYGRSEEDLVRLGQVSHKTLKAWVNKRRVHLKTPDNAPRDGRMQAYMSIYGVDVARKMLQGGQGFAVDVDHPRRDAYAEYEKEAQRAGVGVWHAGRSKQQVVRNLAAASMMVAPLIVLAAAWRWQRRRSANAV